MIKCVFCVLHVHVKTKAFCFLAKSDVCVVCTNECWREWLHRVILAGHAAAWAGQMLQGLTRSVPGKGEMEAGTVLILHGPVDSSPIADRTTFHQQPVACQIDGADCIAFTVQKPHHTSITEGNAKFCHFLKFQSNLEYKCKNGFQTKSFKISVLVIIIEAAMYNGFTWDWFWYLSFW